MRRVGWRRGGEIHNGVHNSYDAGQVRGAYCDVFGEVRAGPENALLLLLIAFLVGEGQPTSPFFEVPGEEARPGAYCA